jgi:hypothetical protein
MIQLNIQDYPDFEEFGTPPCAETFPDAFFTEEKSESNIYRDGRTIVQTWARYDHEKEAKAICAECPYKVRCLAYALKNNEQGIWGGTTERDRRRIMTTIKLNSNSKSLPKV